MSFYMSEKIRGKFESCVSRGNHTSGANTSYFLLVIIPWEKHGVELRVECPSHSGLPELCPEQDVVCH